MKRLQFKIAFKFIFPTLFLFAIACGEKEAVAPQLEGGVGYAAEYTPETLLVDYDNAAGTIVSADTTNDVYVLKAAKLGKKPEKGEVIVVAGELMKKVVSVNEQGDNYEIQMEDAILTDVIENGTIAWELEPEWPEVAAIKVGDEEMPFARGVNNGTLEFKVSSGGVDHQVRISPKLDNGKINACDIKILMTKKVGGSATVAFTAEGTVKLPKQETKVVIENGEISSFTSNNGGITADIDLSMSMAGSKSGSHSLSLPGVALKIPIRVIPTPAGPVPLPIPVSIDIGIQFVSQLTVPSASSSATAKSSLTLSADAGFEYKGSSVETKGAIGDNTITDGTFDSAAGIGIPVDVQFGVAFPRVGLNIAGNEIAYVHTGMTTGSKLQWGPVCKSGYVKMVVEGGYALKFLGVPLAEAKKTFAEKEKRAGDCS